MSRQALARIAGLFYALNVVLGITALQWAQQHRAGADAMTLAGAADYAMVVLLLGRLFEPAGRTLSWTVAAIGLVGCAASALAPLQVATPPFNVIIVFGFYCIGLGTLIVRSGLLPRWIGWLLMVGGLSWLSFALPDLPQRLARTAIGGIPEVLFTLYLLIFAVREERGTSQDVEGKR